MTRFRLATRPLVLFAAMLLASLLIFLPMRLALGIAGVGEQGLRARSVSGSIWGGTLSEARFGELPLGDLSAGLSPFALVIGQARLAFHGTDDPAQAIRGAATVARHLVGINNVTAVIPTGRLFAPLPISQISLDDVSVRFRDGTCEAAEGRVTAKVFGEAGGIALPPSMSGNVRCDAGALLLPVQSQAGSESVLLRIEGDGRYRAELALSPSDPAAAQRLQMLGFIAGQDGYRLSVEGHL